MATIGIVTSLVQTVAGTAQAIAQTYEAFGDIHDGALECVIKRNGPDINKFRTLRKLRKNILDLLTKEDDIKGIGIHGTPGIGKTTIMSNLNDHYRVAKLFDIVIWLKVSNEKGKGNLCIEQLQHDIAQRLKLQMGGTRNPDEVAQRISTVLERRRYLLLLDDVKEPLELCKIGIPDSNNGSKIVLTTRNRPVCKWMNLDRDIKVEYLPIDEAWDMFKDVLQDKDLIEDPEISPVAHKVCEECCGLPLLIKKVASTFKLKTNAKLWDDGLDSWRTWTWPVKDRGGIRELFDMMRFCYEDLKDERSRKCFLYGALYPEDSVINTDSLLECWEAEHLLDHDNDRRTERVKAGNSILLHLQDVSILEEGMRDYHVTMDKFIRQVALHISKDLSEGKHLVKTNKNLSDPPDEESWSKKNRISLGANELDRLPPSPNCSTLSTLFLQENKVLNEIPSEFFNHMTQLRVLDLSDTGIKSLPSSLKISRMLKVLHLNNCKELVEISNIEGLENLEFLDIHGSGISGIPSNIKKLKLLKHLWVSFGNGNDAQSVSLNYQMISKLSVLEVLVIDFEKYQQWTNEVVENIMAEVAKLEKFKKLRVCFPEMIVDVIEVVAPKTVRINVPEARALLSYIQGSSWAEDRKITSFQFFIGLDLKNSGYCRHPNFVRCKSYVKYCNGVVSNNPILEVLAEAEGFELVGHKDIKQLSEFGTANMHKIQGFLIDSCNAMETIIDNVGSGLLPNLAVLIIKNLSMLKSIWKKGPLQPGCQASKLTRLCISNCQVLVNVFPPDAFQQLCVIEYLTIDKCDEVEEVFPQANPSGNLLVLPNLKELILLRLKKLSRICAIESLKLPSLEKLKIFECPDLRKLPFNKKNVENLDCIEAEEEWWGALKWREQKDKEELQELCSFRSLIDDDAAL